MAKKNSITETTTKNVGKTGCENFQFRKLTLNYNNNKKGCDCSIEEYLDFISCFGITNERGLYPLHFWLFVCSI